MKITVRISEIYKTVHKHNPISGHSWPERGQINLHAPTTFKIGKGRYDFPVN